MADLPFDEATKDAVAHWLAIGEVGESSKTIALWLAFGHRYKNAMAPADPDDMDRCLKLLAMVPQLRERLPRMARVCNDWKRLVARWDEVEASFLDEVGIGWTKGRSAPRTFEIMREIYDR